jgi:hypothetical protein
VQGRVGIGEVGGEAFAFQHVEALGGGEGFEFSDQARLADACFAREQEHLALSAAGVFQQVAQDRQLGIPANEHRTDDWFIHWYSHILTNIALSASSERKENLLFATIPLSCDLDGIHKDTPVPFPLSMSRFPRCS